MDRERLRKLLSAAQGEAVSAFLSLLENPDSDVHPDSEQHPVPTAHLLDIYRRRAAHVRRIGLPTLGFDETVERLENTNLERVTLALGTGPDGHPWCVAFLDDDLSAVVATLAVLERPAQE